MDAGRTSPYIAYFVQMAMSVLSLSRLSTYKLEIENFTPAIDVLSRFTPGLRTTHPFSTGLVP